MDAQLAALMRQRGKVIALLVVCGTLVSLVHPTTASTVFPSVALAAGALGGMEAWASAQTPAQPPTPPTGDR